MEVRANVRILNTHRREYKFINNIRHKSEGNGPFGKPWFGYCGNNATVSK
jgi:hypothetical protein